MIKFNSKLDFLNVELSTCTPKIPTPTIVYSICKVKSTQNPTKFFYAPYYVDVKVTVRSCFSFGQYMIETLEFLNNSLLIDVILY